MVAMAIWFNNMLMIMTIMRVASKSEERNTLLTMEHEGTKKKIYLKKQTKQMKRFNEEWNRNDLNVIRLRQKKDMHWQWKNWWCFKCTANQLGNSPALLFEDNQITKHRPCLQRWLFCSLKCMQQYISLSESRMNWLQVNTCMNGEMWEQAFFLIYWASVFQNR